MSKTIFLLSMMLFFIVSFSGMNVLGVEESTSEPPIVIQAEDYDLGGQNVLEPAMLGRPVLFGPHMFNFTEAARLLLAADAAVQVTDATQLAQAVLRYAQDPTLRALAGEQGQRVIAANRGALDVTLNQIVRLLPPADAGARTA